METVAMVSATYCTGCVLVVWYLSNRFLKLSTAVLTDIRNDLKECNDRLHGGQDVKGGGAG